MSTEVWYEFGNNIFEDIFLYVPKIRDNAFWTSENIPLDYPSFVKSYEEGEFGFEVITSFPGDDSTNDLFLVFSTAGVMENHCVKRKHLARVSECVSICKCNSERWGAMFVSVPENIEDVTEFYIVPSVVGLYGLYPVVDRLGKLAYLRNVTFEKCRLGTIEFQAKVIISLKDLPNAPDQIVEGRSEIMHNITNSETNRRRGLVKNVQSVREMGILPFTLHATGNFTWFGRKEGIDQYLQTVDSCTCPIKPGLSKIYIASPSSHSASSLNELYYPFVHSSSPSTFSSLTRWISSQRTMPSSIS